MKKIENYDTGKPEKGQITASEITAWVFKHGDAYPLPQGYDGNQVFYDVPMTVHFSVPDWTSIAKADFAHRMSTSPQQVSRWIKAGMPVREDGRLSYHAAMEWIEEYDRVNKERQMFGWKL